MVGILGKCDCYRRCIYRIIPVIGSRVCICKSQSGVVLSDQITTSAGSLTAEESRCEPVGGPLWATRPGVNNSLIKLTENVCFPLKGWRVIQFIIHIPWSTCAIKHLSVSWIALLLWSHVRYIWDLIYLPYSSRLEALLELCLNPPIRPCLSGHTGALRGLCLFIWRWSLFSDFLSWPFCVGVIPGIAQFSPPANETKVTHSFSQKLAYCIEFSGFSFLFSLNERYVYI